MQLRYFFRARYQSETITRNTLLNDVLLVISIDLQSSEVCIKCSNCLNKGSKMFLEWKRSSNAFNLKSPKSTERLGLNKNLELQKINQTGSKKNIRLGFNPRF